MKGCSAVQDSLAVGCWYTDQMWGKKHKIDLPHWYKLTAFLEGILEAFPQVSAQTKLDTTVASLSASKDATGLASHFQIRNCEEKDGDGNLRAIATIKCEGTFAPIFDQTFELALKKDLQAEWTESGPPPSSAERKLQELLVKCKSQTDSMDLDHQ